MYLFSKLKWALMLGSVLIVTSCIGNPPRIGNNLKTPFIVSKITGDREGLASYSSYNQWDSPMYTIPSIYLPLGMYNIGDTITIKDFKLKH